ncbi:DUF3899 domain-containing protein [Bacillus sp. KH172YL63]|uniref:DUF3899 domain-containing protein n=1 Tax=Bacillus sp. KH172YL63 TaxID=2709784 RepID=UPI0013E502A3|nr:DUF3899 domain-containing protein [Bacillus sp. KH172YL63]BCB03035.1 hypothetical protein KH172YL63_11680 [Bacillus sp. KH172YL63]
MIKLTFFHILTVLFFFVSIITGMCQEKSLLLSFIDSLFIVGITYVATGGLLFIFQKGFFNGIIYSLKRFRNSTKQGKFISQFDDLDETKEAYEEYGVQRSYSITKSILMVGSVAFILSIALSYLLYT